MTQFYSIVFYLDTDHREQIYKTSLSFDGVLSIGIKSLLDTVRSAPFVDSHARTNIKVKAFWLGRDFWETNHDYQVNDNYESCALILVDENLAEKGKEKIELTAKILLMQARFSFKKPKEANVATGKGDIFIVHGHDEVAKQQVARLLTKLELNPIILHEQPNSGRTIIEKFEDYATKTSYAVVLMTPDDDLVDKNGKTIKRTRQNVVLEWGYFAAKLGRNNVCILCKEAVDLPSDILGVLNVPMDSAGAWETKLIKEIKTAGIEIDMNKL
jgi:predicted nucleotide-binding protein